MIVGRMQKIKILNPYLLVSPGGMYDVCRYILLLCEFNLQKTQKAQWIWTVTLFKNVRKKCMSGCGQAQPFVL